MHKNPPKFFVFINKYNNEIFKNKNINIGIIYRNYKDRNRQNQLIKIARACKQNRYQLFVSNDLKLAHKFKADGIYIPSFNRMSLNSFPIIPLRIFTMTKFPWGSKTLSVSIVVKSAYN